jgi:hypothetical protein
LLEDALGGRVGILVLGNTSRSSKQQRIKKDSARAHNKLFNVRGLLCY